MKLRATLLGATALVDLGRLRQLRRAAAQSIGRRSRQSSRRCAGASPATTRSAAAIDTTSTQSAERESEDLAPDPTHIGSGRCEGMLECMFLLGRIGEESRRAPHAVMADCEQHVRGAVFVQFVALEYADLRQTSRGHGSQPEVGPEEEFGGGRLGLSVLLLVGLWQGRHLMRDDRAASAAC